MAHQIGKSLRRSFITIQRWERGTQHPSAYFRTKLCALFGLSAQELGLLEELPPLDSAEPEVEETEAAPAVSAEETRIWMIPFARNPHFTGRDELLALLMQQFSRSEADQPATLRRAALTQSQAIKGLGGIGKTQTAVEYAFRAREQGRYTHIFWINAASEEGIFTSIVAIADLLPELNAEADQRKLVAEVIRWLEQCPQPWLLIADNADNLSLVQPYLPRYGNGDLLYTTRANATGSLGSSIEVETMGVMEGAYFLLHRALRLAEATDEEINEASVIAVALTGYPLALDQAGAYIEETGCSLRDYLPIYERHRRALLARRGRQATGYPESVSTTWSLSFQHIEQTNPAAAELLRLCAFLAPDHIPEELLVQGAPYWPQALQEVVSDPFSFNQMLEALLAFSLVKRLSEDRLLSIHRLVQAVQMERLTPQEQRVWAERVVRAVESIFPRNVDVDLDAWPRCQRYLEQAQACYALLQQHQLLLSAGADILEHTGDYLFECALFSLTEPLFQQALHIREQLAGAEHPHIVSPLTKLARLYSRQGRYVEAERFYQRALYLLEQPGSSELSQLVSTLTGLANLYTSLGQFAQAETVYLRALNVLELEVGPESHNIADTLSGLGWVYIQQGKYAQAEAVYQRSMRLFEQLVGPQHLRATYPMIGLAYTSMRQERYEDAEFLYLQALQLREQQLGLEHIMVAFPLHELGNLYLEQERYAEAESLYLRALRIREQSSGSETRLASDTLNGLARLYFSQQRYTEAEPLYLRALRIREQQLGVECSEVADPLHGLANLYLRQGRHAEAEPLYQRALRIREQKLGQEYPDTLAVMHDYAGFLLVLGKQSEAALLYRRTLAMRERVLGADHPLTRETGERLQTLLVTLGSTEEIAVQGTLRRESEQETQSREEESA